MIYFDNASTSFPKPKECLSEISAYLNEIGGSPGRGNNHRSRKAAAICSETKNILKAELNIQGDEGDIYFSPSATYALNLIIKGSLKNGDHAIICSWSHNSALRPLHSLLPKVKYSVFTPNLDGSIDPARLKSMIKNETKLIIVNHASNVTGSVLDVQKIGSIATQLKVKVLLDASQSIGHIKANYEKFDFVVGAGHKALMGPLGIGFFYTKCSSQLESNVHGGTGVNTFALNQPSTSDRFEVGSLNMTSIAGLYGSLRHRNNGEIDEITACDLRTEALEKLRNMKGLQIYSTESPFGSVPIISFNVLDGYPGQIEDILSKEGVELRSGLHCAPLVHRELGTMNGALRISFSHWNSNSELNRFIDILYNTVHRKRYTRIRAVQENSHGY